MQFFNIKIHKSSKSVPEIDYSVRARVITTTDEERERVTVINSHHCSSVSQPPPPQSYVRAQRRNTMTSGGPGRASFVSLGETASDVTSGEVPSYVSSRGTAYRRCNERFFHGRDSSGPLSEESDSDSDGSSTKSANSETSTVDGVNIGSVVIKY